MKVTINASDLPKLQAAAKRLRRAPANVLDTLLARRGETRESVPRYSRTGKALRLKGVPACAEWQRIDKLPRRVWSDEEAEELIETMTALLKTPAGSMRLWRDQAIALYEIAEQRGLIGGIRVSGGKSWIAMLAPTVLDAVRPMIVVPSKSIKSGKIDKAYQNARKHWQINPDIQWVSYEMIQNLNYADLLLKYRPDCVVADESHKWGRENSSQDTARTARVQRFIDDCKANQRHVPFVLLSGTFMASHVVWDIARACEWALGEGSPLPRTDSAKKDWADALEVDPSYSQKLAARGEDPRPRMAAGALTRWCDTGEPDLDELRKGFGARFTQTPGVVVSSGEAIGQSLIIDVKVNAEHDDVIEQAFVKLRGDPKNDVPPMTPDDWIVVDAPQIWVLAQALELGFYYKADPRPPAEWMLARKVWASYCRERMKRGDIESELQVANECRAYAKEGIEIPAWEEWIAIRPTFKLNVVAEWLSDRRVDQAAAWLKKHKGLCWTQFRPFGERLSTKHRIPFFSADACDIEGNSILEYPGGPAIVSIAACSEDLDLQDRWHSNLVVAPPSSGKDWEQFLARTHRYGQPKPEVTCEVWVGCIEGAEALEKARAKESAVASSSLDDARKLLIADWNDNVHVPHGRGAGRRWSRPSK